LRRVGIKREMLNVLKVWTGFDPANSSRWLPPSELNNKPRRWSKTFWANRFLLAATNAKSVMEFPQDGAESRTATRGRWVAALLWGDKRATSCDSSSLFERNSLRSVPGKPGLPLSGLHQTIYSSPFQVHSSD